MPRNKRRSGSTSSGSKGPAQKRKKRSEASKPDKEKEDSLGYQNTPPGSSTVKAPSSPDDFLLFTGQRGENDQPRLYRVSLPANDTANLYTGVGDRALKSYLDYDPLTSTIYWTGYRVLGDIARASINKSPWNSPTENIVAYRGFVTETETAASSPEELCPNKWEDFGSYSYLLETDTMTYAAAQDYCLSRGGQLTSIRSQDENHYLREKAVEAGQNIWIGLDDLSTTSDDEYAWIDGSGVLTDFYYTNWGNNEPTNGGNEDCASLRSDGKWNDIRCHYLRGYICKKAKGNGCPAGWVQNNDNCYYFETSPANFDGAITGCENRGGMLTSIVSQEENDFLEVHRNSAGFSDDPYFGYHDRNVENSYEWLDGSYQGVFGANWSNGRYPPTTTHDCVKLRQANGYWYDEPCRASLPFVCKRAKGIEGPIRLSPCDEKIYWEENDIIFQTDFDGTESSQVVTGISSIVDFQINVPEQRTVIGHYEVNKDDVVTSYLTFVDLKDGSMTDQIIISSSRITSLDVDWVGSKVYFATSDPLTIQGVNFNGSDYSDVITRVAGFDLTRKSLKIHGDYLYFIYHDTDCSATVRRVLKVPPYDNVSNNMEETLLAGESFVHLNDLYSVGCAATPILSFKEISPVVDECKKLNFFLEVERTIISDENSDPNLQCPVVDIVITPETAGENDYAIQTSDIVFHLNQESQSFSIDIICDDIIGEGDETFVIDSIPPSSSQLTATIRDFTSYFQFKENSHDVLEGAGRVAIPLLREGYLGIPGFVLARSSSITATQSHDFVSTSAKVDFAVGKTEAFVYLQILNDDVVEDQETYELQLYSPSPSTETFVHNIEKTIVNIIDDDFTISLNGSHFSVLESAGSIQIPIIRKGYTESTQNILLAVMLYENPGSAQSGIDFRLLQSSVTFSQGEAIKYVNIDILNDDIGEPNEAFRVVVTDPTQGNAILLEAHVSILDDDVSYQFSSDFYDVDEGNELLRIPVTREGKIYFEETVQVVVTSGTAIADEDYKDRGNITVRFQSGQSSESAFLDIFEDNISEGTENFYLTLNTIGGDELDRAQVSIQDNDPIHPDVEQTYSFEFQSTFVSEEDGSIRLGVLRTRYENEGRVVFATRSRTAVDGEDFIGIPEEMIEFNSGQERSFSSKILIINDEDVEIDEMFSGHLSQANDGVVSTQDAIVTIKDDDENDESNTNGGDGFINISNGILTAIIVGAVVSVIAILAMSMCGCVILFRPKLDTSPARPAIVSYNPRYTAQMRQYYR